MNKLPTTSQNELSVDITLPPPPPPPPSPPEEVSIRKETPKQENRVKTRLLKSPRNQTSTQKSTKLREKESADLTIVKSNAIKVPPPLPVPPLISIDTKMDQKSTTLPGKIGKMERRSSILKEKKTKEVYSSDQDNEQYTGIKS